jgi:hypothetical protein
MCGAHSWASRHALKHVDLERPLELLHGDLERALALGATAAGVR